MDPAFALRCLGAAAAVAAAGLGFGTLIPRPRGRGLPIEMGWGAGLGILSCVVMALGLTHLLTRAAIVAAVATGIGLLLVPAARARLRADVRPDRLTIAPLALLLPAIPLGLTPPTFFDTLMYHLTLPHIYLQQASLEVHPETILSFYPQGTEMLFLAAYAMAGLPDAAAALHTLLAALACLATASLARRLVAPGAGPVAALLLASAPSILVLSCLSKNDMAVVLYVTVVLHEVVAILDGEPASPLLGLAIGFALATKYTAAYILLALLVPAAIQAVRLRRVPRGAALAVTALLAALPAVPWFGRSWLATGNPVYPALSGLFGNAPFQRAGFLNPVERRTLPIVDLLRVPAVVSFGWDGFGAFAYAGPLFLVLGLAALALRAPIRHRGLLLAFVVLDAILWWRTFNVARFLWPLLPPIAAMGAAALGHVRGRSRAWGRILHGIVALAVASNVAVAAWQAGALLHPQRYMTGRESRDAYLTRTYQPYGAIAAANRRLPASARVLFVGETRGLYMERPFVANSANDRTVIVELIAQAPDLDGLVAKLRAERFTHILYNPVEMRRLEDEFAPYLHFTSARERALFQELVAACRKRPVVAHGGVEVWEIPPAGT